MQTLSESLFPVTAMVGTEAWVKLSEVFTLEWRELQLLMCEQKGLPCPISHFCSLCLGIVGSIFGDLDTQKFLRESLHDEQHDN